MNIFSTAILFPMYFVCVSFKEQVGHVTQADLFNYRLIFL